MTRTKVIGVISMHDLIQAGGELINGIAALLEQARHLQALVLDVDGILK